jgi:hypothetical protein
MYYAENQNERIYLSETKQSDQYLEFGYSIYKVNEPTDILIATPEEGYLTDKPQIEDEGSWNPWKSP